METIPAKTIVTKTKSTFWFGLDYNMNIYRGCSHGCIYCDSRSLCYHNTDFGTVKQKENPLEIIRNDLRRKVRTGIVGTGSMSDPYNPLEKNLLLTRHALELINAYEFGVGIATKSSLITRDIDILSDIKRFSPIILKVTITTFDDDLCKKIEPNVSSSSERFNAVKKLSEAGLFTGILLMPILPFINDTADNILNIVHKAKSCGAKFIYPAFGTTLRSGSREYFYDRLDEFFPGIKEKYIKQFNLRYNCPSKNADKLWDIFKNECDKLGILYSMKDIVNSYKMGYGDMQLKMRGF